MNDNRIDRRTFLQAGVATAAGAALSRYAFADASTAPHVPVIEPVLPRADSMIFIWLPGGMAQTDLWDPKKFTPYRQGMRGNELLGTCESIPTSADGIRLGEGLENMASVMHKCTLVRTLSSDVKFGAIHLKAQYYAMTGFLFPNSVKAPSIGAIVGRSRGRRDPNVPSYIYIGRDIDTSDAEKLFISEYIGPGFYGVNHAPFMIPDPSKGMETLYAYGNMDLAQVDRRQEYLKKVAALQGRDIDGSQKASDYMKVMEEARAMMDSPVKKAFDFHKDEKPETIAAYQPRIEQKDLLETDYYYGKRFGEGLLLARRLVERGSRFVQVEYQYGPFKGFDMHHDGQRRMREMKQQIDRPIATLIKDLEERGLLDRTLVVIATEFGRTIASAPAAGSEPDGFAERNTGANLVLDNEKMYGFHGHFSSTSCQLLFGGGFKGGHVHGKTAPEHPMNAIENPITLTDLRATIYRSIGIAANQYFVTEGRPFYVTDNGKGRAAETMLV